MIDSHTEVGERLHGGPGAVTNCASPGANWLPRSQLDYIKRKRKPLAPISEVQVLLSSLFIHST